MSFRDWTQVMRFALPVLYPLNYLVSLVSEFLWFPRNCGLWCFCFVTIVISRWWGREAVVGVRGWPWSCTRRRGKDKWLRRPHPILFLPRMSGGFLGASRPFPAKKKVKLVKRRQKSNIHEVWLLTNRSCLKIQDVRTAEAFDKYACLQAQPNRAVSLLNNSAWRFGTTSYGWLASDMGPDDMRPPG